MYRFFYHCILPYQISSLALFLYPPWSRHFPVCCQSWFCLVFCHLCYFFCLRHWHFINCFHLNFYPWSFFIFICYLFFLFHFLFHTQFIFKLVWGDGIVSIDWSTTLALNIPHKILDKWDLEVWYFGIFSQLAILDWFFTCLFKYERIPLSAYFHWNIYRLFHLIMFWLQSVYLVNTKFHYLYVV